jgi:tetratricopeptide (TPR) repeat protein
VQTSWAALVASWADRRTALREGDPARADAAERALRAAQRELGIENLFPFAAAEVREVARALASNLPAEALSRAQLAVTLAPDLPDAHLARARALVAFAPGSPGPALGALVDAVGAAAREPRTRRAFLGDVLAAALGALLAAACATVLLLAAARLRLFLHDFHHLPLLGGSARVQTAVLALVLLATPAAFGLGPLAAVAILALAAWLYLSARERLVVAAALGVLLALPWAAEAAARAVAWGGTLADRVHQIEHAALADEEAAALLDPAAAAHAPAPLLAALGRHAKRRGDLDAALRLYRAAAEADPRAPELQVNVGNVLFIQDDLEGARAAYLAAQDGAGQDLVVLGAAHYNLSKLYVRTSEMARSAATRERAEREAGGFLAGRGSDDDFSANRYLVDVPVPEAKIAALVALDGGPEAVRVAVEALLAGPLPLGAWPWAAGSLLAALAALTLAARRIAPARRCERCGRPACGRCDGATGTACGQCVNVFERRGVVDPRDRLRKEREVRRTAALTRLTARALAVLGGGAGHVITGAPVRGALLMGGILFSAFLILSWRGVVPPPYPSQYALAGKLAVAVPLGLALWALAIRDLYRRTRS